MIASFIMIVLGIATFLRYLMFENYLIENKILKEESVSEIFFSTKNNIKRSLVYFYIVPIKNTDSKAIRLINLLTYIIYFCLVIFIILILSGHFE